MNGSEWVFVYGVLREGASDAFRMLGDDAEFVRMGRAEGNLYEVGGIPVAVFDRKGGRVVGELWRVSPGKLDELDAFVEGRLAGGAGFRRSLVWVRPQFDEWGEDREAWAWEGGGEIDSGRCVPSGDWLDVERPRVPAVLSGLGLLGLVAMPVGIVPFGLQMDSLPVSLPRPWGEWLAVFVVAPPLVAWLLTRLGERRRERGEVLRRITRALVFVWIWFAALGLAFFLLAGMGSQL